MIFSSLIFLFAFLPVLCFVYFLFNKIGSIRLNNVILLIGSIVFILWGSGKDILILFIMIMVNYISGLMLTSGQEGTLLKGQKRTAYQKAVLIVLPFIELRHADLF